MKRLILSLSLLLLLLALASWWYRKEAAEAALAWALSVFSPTKVEFEITSFEPPQIAFNRVVFPEIGLEINSPVLEIGISSQQRAFHINLLQGAKLEYNQAAFMLRGLFQAPWVLQRSFDDANVDFKQTRLDLKGSTYSSPAIVLQCAECALRVDQGVFSSAAWELQGAIELKKIKSSLALAGKEDLVRDIFVEGNVQSMPAGIKLNVEKLKASIFGGSMALSKKVTANVQADCFSLPLSAKGIEISKILELYPTSQVSASGSLIGTLPFVYCKNNWRIENAILQSMAGGNIKLGAAHPASGNQQVDFAFQALRDFDYSELKAQLSMHSDGKLQITFNIEGISRSLQKNTPLVVNLNVEENLWELLKSVSIVKQINDSFSGGQARK